MTKEKGIIERAMEETAPQAASLHHTYFIHYTCEAMGKQLATAKVFKFPHKISGTTYDSILNAIAQHEKVATVTITNFIELSE